MGPMISGPITENLINMAIKQSGLIIEVFNYLLQSFQQTSHCLAVTAIFTIGLNTLCRVYQRKVGIYTVPIIPALLET